MRVKIIKWIIGWMIRKHFRLLYEAVIPTDAHIHRNPVKKPPLAGSRADGPMQPATSGVDE